MGIRVRLCSDWCLREADDSSDYPQTSVSCIVRTQYPYFAQRYAGITGFGPVVGSVSIFLFQDSRFREVAEQYLCDDLLTLYIGILPAAGIHGVVPVVAHHEVAILRYLKVHRGFRNHRFTDVWLV